MARFAAEGERAEISDFCRGIVLCMVQAVEIPAAPAPRRPVGRARGNFAVTLFAQTNVTQLVEKVLASDQKFKIPRMPAGAGRRRNWDPGTDSKHHMQILKFLAWQ